MDTINFDEYRYWYVNRDAETIYVGFNEKLDKDSNAIGEGWDDYAKGYWVILSQDNIMFKESNSDASVEEVLKLQLMPKPVPTPEELLYVAKEDKKQEVFDQDIHHYYLDGKDIYMHGYGRAEIKDRSSHKNNITFNYITYPSDIIIEAINEMYDYDDSCNIVTDNLLKAIEKTTTIEEVKNIEVAGYPEVIRRTTEELQSAIDYKKQHDSEVQVLRVSRMSISAMTMDDTTAVKNKYGHAEWIDFIGGKLEIGNRVLYNDWLWKVRQPINPVLEIYPPSIDTAALYERLDENHEGTEFDPKLYASGMALEQDKYYTELDNGARVKYFCYRGSIDPVYSKLKDLVDLYVRPVD